jgi:hypothetical protein
MMMASTEEFLVSIGIDQSSINKLVSDIDAAKRKAAADPVAIQMAVQMDQNIGPIVDEMRQLREQEEAAAAAAQDLATIEGEAAAAAQQMADQMKAAAEATATAMRNADEAMRELQGGLIAVGIAAAGVSAIFNQASNEAMDDEAAVAELRVAYGALADEAIRTSEEIAKATGRQTADVQRLLATANLAAASFGVVGDEAARMSEQLVRIAIDMSAVTGTNAATIVDQFRTGLLLSGRALRQYGINLDEARVKAELFAKGINPKTATQAQEAQAKLAIILKDTTKYLGAASSENQTFTERMKDMSAAVSEAFGALGASVNEIIKPFIEDITKVVVKIKEWIEANPALTKTAVSLGLALVGIVTAVGLLAGTIAAVTFAFKQFAAAQIVLTGIQIAFAGSMVESAAATTADTAATVANTAAKEANTAATSASAIANSNVGKAVDVVKGILGATTGQVLTNAKAWAGMVATKVGDWMFNAWTGLTKMADGVLTLGGHLLRGEIGLRTFVNMLGSELSPALLTNVSQFSALGTAALAAGTAIAGFKIGGMIEQFFGLADAEERVIKGTADTSDKIKSGIVDVVLAAIPVVGWFALAWKKYYEAQAEGIRTTNAAEIKKQVDALNPEQLLRYNQYLKEGMVDWMALKAAIGDTAGEITRFQYLLGLKTANKGMFESLGGQQELDTLYRKLGDSVQGFAERYAEQMGLVKKSTEDIAKTFGGAKAVLADTQKAFDEYKKKLDETQIKLNFGEDVGKAVVGIEELGKAMETFRARAQAHQTVLADLFKTKTSSAVSGETIQADISKQLDALKEIRRYTEIAAQEQLRITEEAFRKQLSAQENYSKDRIKKAEDEKNKLVAIERKRVDEIEQEIKREEEIRKSANERARDFEKKLDQDALRRTDATQAEIKSLVESAAAALKDSTDQETRARVLAKVAAELERLAKDETDAKRIAEDLAAARKQLTRDEEELAKARERLNEAATKEGEARGDPQAEKTAAEARKDAARGEADAKERLATDAAKVAELEKNAAKEKQLLDDRAKLAAAEKLKLEEESAAQQEAANERDQRIADLQNERLQRELAIKDAQVEYTKEVAKSVAEFENAVKRLERMETLMTSIIGLQKEVTQLAATPGAEAAAERYQKSGTLAAQQVTLTSLQTEQQNLGVPEQSFTAAVTAAVEGLKQSFMEAKVGVEESATKVKEAETKVTEAQAAVEASTIAVEGVRLTTEQAWANVSAAVANLQPATQALVDKAQQVQDAVAPVPEAMNSALDAQSSMATSMEKLGNTTVEFAAGMKARWNDVTKRLEKIESNLNSLKNEGGSEAAAAGY